MRSFQLIRVLKHYYDWRLIEFLAQPNPLALGTPRKDHGHRPTNSSCFSLKEGAPIADRNSERCSGNGDLANLAIGFVTNGMWQFPACLPELALRSVPAYHDPAYHDPAYHDPAYHDPAYPVSAYQNLGQSVSK